MVNNSNNINKTNNHLKQLNSKEKTYGVGNPGRGLRQEQICDWIKPVIYFVLYCIAQFKKSHMVKLDCCRHLRPSDFSYFTISFRNHYKNLCD